MPCRSSSPAPTVSWRAATCSKRARRSGTISDIQPTQDNSAIVTIDVNDSHWPFHAGLVADIRPKSLLGEKYVDLHDGPAGSPAYDASTMLQAPPNAVPVELDQFINSLDATTRTAVQVLLDDLGAGVAAQGPTSTPQSQRAGQTWPTLRSRARR